MNRRQFLTLSTLVAIPMAPTPARAVHDYCDADGPTTLLLVDRTTAYNRTDQEAFAHGLQHIYTTLRPRERMVVQTITHEYAASERIFDRCWPACAPGTSGLFGQCSRFDVDEDAQAFAASLRSVGRQLVMSAPELPRSEILMTIALATRELSARNLRRVFIFSDLMENSPTTYPWPTLLAETPAGFLARAQSLGARPNITGAIVTIFGFGRDHTAQRRSLPPQQRAHLEAMWRPLFASGGARSISFGLRIA